MKKIAFVGHDLKFVTDIINKFEENSNYEVKIDKWSGHEIHDEKYSKTIIEWADIIFCEWGLGNVVWYQKHKKKNQKLFVRLHRFEMNTKYPLEFDYKKIDKLIAISPYIYEEFHRIAKIPREKMTMIFNAVDMGKFDIAKNKDSEFNIGIIGIAPKLKRLDRALDILENLLKKDNRYKLYIKGKHPKEHSWIWNDKEERNFYDKAFKRIKDDFNGSVLFEGWGNVGEWLQNISYILSVSDYESFHMAPIEGMASGAYPLVLNEREGVKTIFPKEFIFETNNEIVDYILSEKDKKIDLKKYVKDNYDLDKMFLLIENLFDNEIILSNKSRDWEFKQTNKKKYIEEEGEKLKINVLSEEVNYLYYKPLENISLQTPKIITFDTKTDETLDIQLFFMEYKKGKQIKISVVEPKNERIFQVQKSTDEFRIALRTSGKGIAIINKILIKEKRDFEQAKNELLPIKKEKYLILTNVYPSQNDLYRNGFVHRRAKLYQEKGLNIDIFSMKKLGTSLGKYRFNGVDVFNGDLNSLTMLLDSVPYKKILIHFVNHEMIEGIKNSKKEIPLITWIHGFETERWHRRRFNYTEDEISQNRSNWEESDNKKMKLMRDLYINPKNKFIFVSKWFKEAVAEEDTDCKVANYEIIPNVVDENIFNFMSKSKEDRKKILTIRPFASRKYANDLTVKALLKLSKEDFFKEMEVSIYGKGSMFNEILKPLRKFENIKIYEKFLTQEEITNEHKKHGIFMCPTRLDAQGVSMCEAMSSGLIPITNGVTAIPEYVSKDTGILAEEEDYMGLYKGIKELYEDPDKFIEMSKNASKKINNQCGIEVVIEKELKAIKGD